MYMVRSAFTACTYNDRAAHLPVCLSVCLPPPLLRCLIHCLQVLVKVMPMPLFRTYSAVIRGANNIVGGISFVTIARMFGVQKSGTI